MSIEMLQKQTSEKRERLKSLVITMLNELPQPMASMVLIYRSSVIRLVDNMEDDRIDEIISKVKEMILFVENGEISNECDETY